MYKLLIPLAIGATILFSGCSTKQESRPSDTAPEVVKKVNITIKNEGGCSLPASGGYISIPHE